MKMRPAKIDRPASHLGLAVCTILSACAGGEAAPEPAPALPVAVFEVRRQAHHLERIVLGGQVRSGRASRLGFERSGKLARLLVDEGAEVAAGEPLARLDVRQLRSAERKLVAARRRAEADRGLSEITARRLERLAMREFTPAQRADEARFGFDAARASVDELEAALAQVRLDIAKSVLRAPFSGVVRDRLVDEGTVVAAGGPVLRLLGDATREVVVGVPARDRERFEVGQRRPVEVGGADLVGRVTGRVDAVDPRTRTVGVILALPPDAAVVDGRTARLSFERRVEGEGFWVPLSALRPGARGTWTLLSVHPVPSPDAPATDEPAAEARAIAVEVLHLAPERAFVTGDLPTGARVVAEGLHRVVPGQRVTVRGGPS